MTTHSTSEIQSPTRDPGRAPAVSALLARLGVGHELDAPLAPRTWFGVGGWAEAQARPESIEQLQAIVRAGYQHDIPLRVLGKGANLLVREQRVPGVVIALDSPGFQRIEYPEADGERGASALIRARGGADLFKLVRDTARAGLSGLEHVAGIPATVGGAVRMNAGGAFGEIGDSVISVTVIRDNGELETLPGDTITFGYRHTDIAAPLIVDVTFALTRADAEQTTARMKEIFAYKSESQPMGDRSAGCAFKNPTGQSDKGAGQLIDEAGLKGCVLGTARVSPVHGNFITVDKRTGRTEDVYRLMQHVEQQVADFHGVTLEREMVVWP